MEKPVLKIVSVIVFLFLISSCETNDDSASGIIQEEVILAGKSNQKVNYATKSDQNPSCWYIEEYQGGTVVFNQEGIYPYVGVTVVGVSNETCKPFLGWIATGSFSIVESNSGEVKAIRNSTEEGEISYLYQSGSNIAYSRIIYKAIPSSLICPENKDSQMEQYYSTVYPKHYNPDYTYEWTIVDNLGTRYSTGRDAQLRRGRTSRVTLKVSKTGNNQCDPQTRNQSFYVDGRPGR